MLEFVFSVSKGRSTGSRLCVEVSFVVFGVSFDYQFDIRKLGRLTGEGVTE